MAGLSNPVVAGFDRAVDGLFEPLRSTPGEGPNAADRVFYTASKAAEFSLCWHVASGIGALLVPSRRPEFVRLTVALGIESVLVNAMIKPIFKRDRPDLVEGAPHLRRPKTASFPSGHASSASMAAVLLSHALPAARPIWWTSAAIVATSRIHTRMHHGTDVAAGAIVGTTLGRGFLRIPPSVFTGALKTLASAVRAR